MMKFSVNRFRVFLIQLAVGTLGVGAANAHNVSALHLSHSPTGSAEIAQTKIDGGTPQKCGQVSARSDRITCISDSFVLAQAAKPKFAPNHPIRLPPTKPVRGVIYHPLPANGSGSGADGAPVASHHNPPPPSDSTRCSARPC